MSKLQQHYYNFQSLPTIPEKILYLQKHSKDLYQYNINVRNLIRAWTTNDWPHLRPKQEHPGFQSLYVPSLLNTRALKILHSIDQNHPYFGPNRLQQYQNSLIKYTIDLYMHTVRSANQHANREKLGSGCTLTESLVASSLGVSL